MPLCALIFKFFIFDYVSNFEILYIYVISYFYLKNLYIKEATPHSAGPGQRGRGPGKVPCGAMLGSFEIQVGDLGGLSWRFGTFLGSMLGLVGHKWGFGRSRGHREGVWKGLGWLRGGWGPGSGSNMGPT